MKFLGYVLIKEFTLFVRLIVLFSVTTVMFAKETKLSNLHRKKVAKIL